MSDINMKKYVVTDPGYITKDDDVWEHFVKVINDEEMRNKVLSDYLGCQIFTSATGYGDWQNFIKADSGEDRILQDEFCADSGMVCFCEMTQEIEERLKRYGSWAYAILECEDPKIEFDRTDPEWTVLKITDTNSVYTSIVMNPDRIAEYLATGDDDDE